MTDEGIKALSFSSESTATKLSSPSHKEPLEENKGLEKSDSTALNGDVNPDKNIEVAIDAPKKTLNETNEHANHTEPHSPIDDKCLSPVLENTAKETSKDMSNEDLNTLHISPKATPNNSSSGGKSKARRRSNGIPEHRTKKINKKSSKARVTHIDAKPGDYFYVRLKGYPLWPAIVCDETMLPESLIKSRPVTAARADGTYREDFMDGAPKAKDRSFPVMYLFTNEFGWIANYDLLEIDFDEVANITGSMRKDLVMARQLAAERHDLEYFKEILKSFMEATENERLEHEKAEQEKLLLKEKKDNPDKKKTIKKSRKPKVVFPKDEDSVMADLNDKTDFEDSEVNQISSVKRPAEEALEGPPKKRTTIKLTTKTKLDSLAPKFAKVSDSKKKKSDSSEKPEKMAKVKKIKVSLAPNSSASTTTGPMEPELTTEEKRMKREKEILFLRHRLQKGLLAKDHEARIEDMKLMSEFIEKLEAYNDLEVSIIRQTKINKVLKAILKIPKIPLENEYRFKPRSQYLLDQWSRLQTESENPALSTTNGVVLETKPGSDQVHNPKSEPRKEKETSKNVALHTVDDAVDSFPENDSKKMSTVPENSGS